MCGIYSRDREREREMLSGLGRGANAVVTKIGMKEQVENNGTKPEDNDTLIRQVGAVGGMNINEGTFMKTKVLLNVTVLAWAVAAEDECEDFCDDDINANVNMTSC